MTRAEIVAAIATAAAAMLLAVPPVPAHADPGCFDSSDPTCGGHTWNGPLRQTWDTPGFYGGNTGGDPILCSPFTYQCAGAIPSR
jgi:hypothetical protein